MLNDYTLRRNTSKSCKTLKRIALILNELKPLNALLLLAYLSLLRHY